MSSVATMPAARWAGALRRLIEVVGCVVAAIVLGLGTSNTQTLRLGVAAVLVAAMTAVGVRAPERLIVGTIGWLVVLGLVRRLLTVLSGSSANDPVLLVGAF